MRNEQEIRRLMQAGMQREEPTPRTLAAVSRARQQVGQRDTLSFALVKIWAAFARMLAPLFARFGEHQAKAVYERMKPIDRSDLERD